ncbi:MAG: 3-hydroxyacyl-CoA dehydrogenase family protein [Planctomycetales bacterium]|nr:3-hydroxyacyl-CoA dehydrogenase family protein [Planctomycetales bacterium]
MQSTNDPCLSGIPKVLLVGAGVVGRAIADAHAVGRIPFYFADCSEDSLNQAARRLAESEIPVEQVRCPIDGMFMCSVGETKTVDPDQPLVVIESIIEQVDAKRKLFTQIQEHFGGDAVLCSNTSTLQIDEIAGKTLASPQRLCGMHFFMPVHARAAVEVVSGIRTDPEVIDAVVRHATRIGKRAIRCKDGPGFIVNRMLSPYLNQSLLLLCRGATEDQINRAALAFGMPMSPLELIDWIGAPTMYHAGKAFWSAFPNRIDPSPIIPALVKQKRLGRSGGAGLFDYADGQRSTTLSDAACQLVQRYRLETKDLTDGDVLMLLSIPMWIEANSLLEEGIADSMATVDLAMAGGLGFSGDMSWSGFFAEVGADCIDDAIRKWQSDFRSMRR